MKRVSNGLPVIAFFALFIGLASVGLGRAQVVEAVKYIGSDVTTATITASSAVPVAIFSASMKRPDGACTNIATTTVWISTVSTAHHGFTPTPQTIGYPLLSNQEIRLEGKMTGALYASCATTVSSCELRCIYGLTR